MIRDSRNVVRRILITERATELQKQSNKFLFEVRRDANKVEIQNAIEAMFNVDVVKVNTASVHGKVKRLGRFQGRRADWKKATVTLAEGQRIDFFEGV